MEISWNLWLVCLSVLVAVIGSFGALTHAKRMRESAGNEAALWMLTGGFVLGLSIWSMHFIAMLAMNFTVPVAFDQNLTFLSALPAIVSALFAFWVLRVPHISYIRLAVSSVLMGSGISLMHYTGMSALMITPAIKYHSYSMVLSMMVAVLASWVALFLMCHYECVKSNSLPRFILSGTLMGGAISGMHYSSMLGMEIQAGSHVLSDVSKFDHHMLALLITAVAFFWFCGGIFASLLDRRLAQSNKQALINLEQQYLQLMSDSEKRAKEMSKSLRESEERLRITLKYAPDAVFICKKDGQIIYVNDSAVALLAYSRKKLYSMNILDLAPEDWRGVYRVGLREILNDDEHSVREIRLVKKNGVKIPVDLNAVLLPNGRIYGSCRDITERKLAQRALQDSEETSQLLLNSVAEGIYGVDMKGVCTFVNAAFLRILGYPNASDVVGRKMHDLIHHSYADGTPYPFDECRIYHSFRDRQAFNVDDEVFWHRDGSTVAVEYWSHPIVKNGVVLGAVVTFLDITERKLAEGKIHQLAFYDPLTSLPNRRLLLDRLSQAFSVTARNGYYGALMFIDLDNFKTLNDSKGHDMGDLLLVEVAHRLKRCVREGDTVARLGGDEFVVVLEMLSANLDEAVLQTEMRGEKIRAVLNQPYQLQQYSQQSSPSIGVVVFRGHQESIDNLLKYADTAMYQAKAAGRNAIRFYDPDMQAALEAHIELESELRAALKKQQFRLYYQIQVDTQRRPIGAEVLLRWVHHTRGLISPLEFIPLAEETGLIVPIGLWVLQTACAQLKLWQTDALTCDLKLAVNVSARQFRQPDFVAQVTRVLEASGARASHLKLELTESIVLESAEEVINKMREIKRLGVSFSMDDFGTGYSSLQYLKRLPLDQIKIDQSFVRDITTDPNDAVIVQTVIAMSKAMGLDVIAEGVETEAQMDFLERSGCQSFQGYLFSKPVPLDALPALLNKPQ